MTVRVNIVGTKQVISPVRFKQRAATGRPQDNVPELDDRGFNMGRRPSGWGSTDARGAMVGVRELRRGDKKTQFDAIQKVEYINDPELALHIRPFLDDESPVLPITADQERVQFIRMNDAAIKTIAVLFNQPFSFRIEQLRPCTDAEIEEAKMFFQKK